MSNFRHRVDRSLLALVTCETLRRLGSPHDGGYVVPVDAIERATTLLSFGLATNWSFERAAVSVNPRLRVEAYDPTVGNRTFVTLAVRAGLSVPLRLLALSPIGARSSFRKLRVAVDYFRFFSGVRRHHRQRVWHNRDRGSASIDDAIARTGTAEPLSIFVKIDVEGTEYRILPTIAEHAELFTGIVIEFHDTDICADVFNTQMALLRERFEVVHVHGNNYGDLSADGALPIGLEITLLNRRMFEGTPATYRGPLPRPGLDYPNNPGSPDYAIML